MTAAEHQKILEQKGYQCRAEYFDAVAETYGLDVDDVYVIASFLGPMEDFDGLLSACADAAGTVIMSV